MVLHFPFSLELLNLFSGRFLVFRVCLKCRVLKKQKEKKKNKSAIYVSKYKHSYADCACCSRGLTVVL